MAGPAMGAWGRDPGIQAPHKQLLSLLFLRLGLTLHCVSIFLERSVPNALATSCPSISSSCLHIPVNNLPLKDPLKGHSNPSFQSSSC